MADVRRKRKSAKAPSNPPGMVVGKMRNKAKGPALPPKDEALKMPHARGKKKKKV